MTQTCWKFRILLYDLESWTLPFLAHSTRFLSWTTRHTAQSASVANASAEKAELTILMVLIVPYHYLLLIGFPGGARGKDAACQWRRDKRCRFDPWGGKTHWRRKWQPTPVFFPGESHGQRSLMGYSSWGCRVGLNWRDLAQHHYFWDWQQLHVLFPPLYPKLFSSNLKTILGTSLVVQWLRLCLPMQGVQVQSLVRELRFNMSCSQKLKT